MTLIRVGPVRVFPDGERRSEGHRYVVARRDGLSHIHVLIPEAAAVAHAVVPSADGLAAASRAIATHFGTLILYDRAVRSVRAAGRVRS